MASKSAQGTETSNETIAELLDLVDKALDRVKVLYEQYFLGIQKQPPTHLHTDAERKLRDLAHIQIRNTALRYRFAMIQQKMGSYNSYWRRTLRQIENGTYTRNLMKIGRQAVRTGADIPEEILAAMPKRMRDQVLRDREAALTIAARRGSVSVSDEEMALDDVDLVDLVDLEDVAEPRPVDKKTATGAHILSEADADFDMDAFFADVQAGTIPPPMQSVAQRLGATAIPTIKATSPVSTPLEPASPAPFVPPLSTTTRSVVPPHATTLPMPTVGERPRVPTPISGVPRTTPATGVAHRPTTPAAGVPAPTPAEPSRAVTLGISIRPSTPATGVPPRTTTPATGVPQRTSTPATGVPVTSATGAPRPTTPATGVPPRPTTPATTPQRPMTPATGVPQMTLPMPPIRRATPAAGVPVNPPVPPGGVRAATPATGVPTPATERKPSNVQTQPMPAIGERPRMPTPPAGIPKIPSPRSPTTPPIGVPAIPRSATTPPAGVPTMRVPTIPVRSGAPSTAPSQVTRPNPIAPGASQRIAPVEVETMAGPFPREPEPAKPAQTRSMRPVEKPEPPPRATTPMRPPPGMSDADVGALYSKYVQAKQSVGEQAGPGAYKKLLNTINQQAPKIMEQYKAKGVDFTVVVKDNQVIIRAKPKG